MNGWFYLYDERFPVAFTLLAIAGTVGRPPFRRERVAMAIYFLVFFAIGLVFYAGSYNYGADVRYSLMTYPPIAVLGGLGAAQRGSQRLSDSARALPGAALTAALLAFQFLWYAPVVRATTEEAWAARADVRFAQAAGRGAAAQLVRADPQSRHVPSLGRQRRADVAGRRRPGAYTRVLDRRYTGGIYCTGTSGATSRIRFSRRFAASAMATGARRDRRREYRERDQRYAFYRLTNRQLENR